MEKGVKKSTILPQQGVLTPRKFHVYIIESPSAADLYNKRFEGEALSQTLRLSGIQATHKLIVREEALRASFYVGISEYFKNPSTQNVAPIIHISAHGDQSGIQLSDTAVVTWDELKSLLVPINKILGGGLLLCLSSCQSLSGCKMAMLDDDFPFMTIIGCKGQPSWGETNLGFATFYHLFAKGYSFEESVEAMKKASGNNEFQYLFAEEARNIYKQYLEIGERQQIIDAFKRQAEQIKPKKQ